MMWGLCVHRLIVNVKAFCMLCFFSMVQQEKNLSAALRCMKGFWSLSACFKLKTLLRRIVIKWILHAVLSNVSSTWHLCDFVFPSRKYELEISPWRHPQLFSELLNASRVSACVCLWETNASKLTYLLFLSWVNLFNIADITSVRSAIAQVFYLYSSLTVSHTNVLLLDFIRCVLSFCHWTLMDVWVQCH